MSGDIVLRRVTDLAPPVISPRAARRVTADLASPYVQEALALDFCAPDPEFAHVPTRRASLPDAQEHAELMAQAIIEVAAGIRPAPQLIRHFTPTLYGLIARRALRAGQRRREASRMGVPDRAPRVRRVLVCEPADGIAEACAVIVLGSRANAVAFRMEGLDGRWLVTALTIG